MTSDELDYDYTLAVSKFVHAVLKDAIDAYDGSLILAQNVN